MKFYIGNFNSEMPNVFRYVGIERKYPALNIKNCIPFNNIWQLVVFVTKTDSLLGKVGTEAEEILNISTIRCNCRYQLIYNSTNYCTILIL